MIAPQGQVCTFKGRHLEAMSGAVEDRRGGGGADVGRGPLWRPLGGESGSSPALRAATRALPSPTPLPPLRQRPPSTNASPWKVGLQGPDLSRPRS